MGRGGEASLKSAAGASVKKLTANEVRKHSTPENCWIVIRGKVYDVSQWSSHPGGAVLFTHAGQDATSVFAGFHGSSAYETMTQFYIGDCDELLTKDTDFEREIRALGPEMKRRGLYDARFVRAGAWGTRTGPLWLHTPSARLDGKHHNHVVLLLPRYSLLSLLYYTYKFFSTTAIGLLGIFIAYNWRNMWGAVAAGLVIGTFWQQCGWMAHDFCHHQVFKNRRYNDYMTMVIGSYLGFSLGWWKNKHNTHHAIPNVHESATDAHDGDPDIDTLPFLAWSPKLLRKVMGGTEDSALSRFCVSHQAFIYFPLLLLARLTWALQSAAYVFRLGALYWGSQSSDDVAAKKAREAAAVDGVVVAGNHVDISAVKLRYEVLERLALIVHYVWYAGMMITLMTPASAAVFFAVSQMFSGLLIAIAFGVGHNGMPVFDADKKPGFAELAIRTTRNVDDTPFTGWFMGGLHYQVEHHIFPTVPRHNLKACRALVEPIARKYGVPYHSTTMWAGTVEVLEHLAEVAKGLTEHGPM